MKLERCELKALAASIAFTCACHPRAGPPSAASTPDAGDASAKGGVDATDGEAAADVASRDGALGSGLAEPPVTEPGPAEPSAFGPNASTLLRLSRAWAKDSDLVGQDGDRRPVHDTSRCPQVGRDLRPENRRLVPTTFVPFEAIATHACDAVLWVYLGCTAASTYKDDAVCAWWRERLVLESIGGGRARVLGSVDPVLGANSGGLFVPFALSRDDRRVLLRAWMYSPAAGGGAVDYGVGTIDQSAHGGKTPLVVRPLDARNPFFYDDFGCAIGLAASPKLPRYPQPGHPSDNGGRLVVLDLANLRPHTLLEEADTTYSLDRIHEKARVAQVTATPHRFGPDCPRDSDDALDCSVQPSNVRTIPLPACVKWDADAGQGTATN